MKQNVKLVIFDCYGFAFTGGYPESSRLMAKRFNKDWGELYQIFYKKYFNMASERKITQKQAWQLAVKEAGLPISWKEARELHYSVLGRNEKVIELAERLQKEVTLVLLSKNTRSQFHETQKLLGGDRIFQNRINTFEWGMPKAGKETIEKVLKKFKAKPEETIYIDDQEENLMAAREIGVKTIWYQYDFDRFMEEFKEVYNK